VSDTKANWANLDKIAGRKFMFSRTENNTYLYIICGVLQSEIEVCAKSDLLHLTELQLMEHQPPHTLDVFYF